MSGKYILMCVGNSEKIPISAKETNSGEVHMFTKYHISPELYEANENESFAGVVWTEYPARDAEKFENCNEESFVGLSYSCKGFKPKKECFSSLKEDGKFFIKIELNERNEKINNLSQEQSKAIYYTIKTHINNNSLEINKKKASGIFEIDEETYRKFCQDISSESHLVNEEAKESYPGSGNGESGGGQSGGGSASKEESSNNEGSIEFPKGGDSTQSEKDEICTNPKFVIFDEMNLARVEYYLADVLSAMELGNDSACKGSGGVRLELGPRDEMVVPWPDDLYMLGTANMDETTYSFSPKVLDRSFYIRYCGNDIDLKEKKDEEEKVIAEVAEKFKACKDFFVRSDCYKKLRDEEKWYGWPENSSGIDDSIPCALAAALATKGFVILGGLSGAGKTRLARLFAEKVLGEGITKEEVNVEIEKKMMLDGCILTGKTMETLSFTNPLILSVRPDWRDGSSVIGYYNAITNERKETPFSQMLRIVNEKCKSGCDSISKEEKGNAQESSLIKKIGDIVQEILEKMNNAEFGVSFGHRAYNEISAFIYNYLMMRGFSVPEKPVSEDLNKDDHFKDALSWAVVMKMLPKFHGSKESIENQLENLKGILKEDPYNLADDTRAIRDIKILQKELDSNDYAIYA